MEKKKIVRNVMHENLTGMQCTVSIDIQQLNTHPIRFSVCNSFIIKTGKIISGARLSDAIKCILFFFLYILKGGEKFI